MRTLSRNRNPFDAKNVSSLFMRKLPVVSALLTLISSSSCLYSSSKSPVGGLGFMIPSAAASKSSSDSNIIKYFELQMLPMAILFSFVSFRCTSLLSSTLFSCSRNKYATKRHAPSTFAYLSHSSAVTFVLLLSETNAYTKSVAYYHGLELDFFLDINS